MCNFQKTGILELPLGRLFCCTFCQKRWKATKDASFHYSLIARSVHLFWGMNLGWSSLGYPIIGITSNFWKWEPKVADFWDFVHRTWSSTDFLTWTPPSTWMFQVTFERDPVTAWRMLREPSDPTWIITDPQVRNWNWIIPIFPSQISSFPQVQRTSEIFWITILIFSYFAMVDESSHDREPFFEPTDLTNASSRIWKNDIEKTRISSFWVKYQSPSSKTPAKLWEKIFLYSKRFAWESICFFLEFFWPRLPSMGASQQIHCTTWFQSCEAPVRLFAVPVLQIKDGRISVIVFSEKGEMLRWFCSTVGKSKSYHSWKMSPSTGRNLQLTYLGC